MNEDRKHNLSNGQFVPFLFLEKCFSYKDLIVNQPKFSSLSVRKVANYYFDLIESSKSILSVLNFTHELLEKQIEAALNEDWIDDKRENEIDELRRRRQNLYILIQSVENTIDFYQTSFATSFDTRYPRLHQLTENESLLLESLECWVKLHLFSSVKNYTDVTTVRASLIDNTKSLLN